MLPEDDIRSDPGAGHRAARRNRRGSARRLGSTGTTWPIVRDGLTALAVFGLVAGSIGSEGRREVEPATAQNIQNAASLRLIESGYVDPNLLATSAVPFAARESRRPVLAGADYTSAVVLLTFMFAAVMAFNLAFLRHLGRVHASPRSRGRGRG